MDHLSARSYRVNAGYMGTLRKSGHCA